MEKNGDKVHEIEWKNEKLNHKLQRIQWNIGDYFWVFFFGTSIHALPKLLHPGLAIPIAHEKYEAYSNMLFIQGGQEH